jgi:hypothetical protein
VKDPAPEIITEPKLTLENLGAQVDTALANVGPAKVDVEALFNLPGGRGNARPDALIKDHDTFRIDWYFPGEGAKPNRVVANEGEMIELSKEGWKSTSRRGGAFTKTELADWDETFYRDVFAGFLDGRDMFGPLFSYWSDESNGIKVTFDEREQLIDGRDYKFYTVLAEMEGDDARLIEVKIDSVRLLPVAIRTHWGESEPYYYKLWSAKWAFGGEHDPKVFDLSIADN